MDWRHTFEDSSKWSGYLQMSVWDILVLLNIFMENSTLQFSPVFSYIVVNKQMSSKMFIIQPKLAFTSLFEYCDFFDGI